VKQIIKTVISASAGITFAIGVLALAAPHVFAHGDKAHTKTNQPISTEDHPWGRQGDPKKVTRTINISMTDNMRFTPDAINVKQGETIRFVVNNSGKLMHEMVIGTKEELAKHAEQMKKHPNMEHDEPYMAHVATGKKVDLVWHFSNAGAFEFACLIAGHFEAGMKGKIVVAAKQ
jgi:uncharacterized cupredoxin-like copper-binding protein